MRVFKNLNELSGFLRDLGPQYTQYASKLWNYGVRSLQELMNASPSTLKKAGVANDLHIDNIKASAAALCE